MRKIIGLVFASTILLGCTDNSKNDSSISQNASTNLSNKTTVLPSSNQNSSASETPLDGYIVPYNNSFSRLVAVEEEISRFKQENQQNHYFYTMDDTKISNLIDIKYTINGYYHTERHELFSLESLTTTISIKEEEEAHQITISTNGTNESSLNDFSMSSNGSPYSIMINNNEIGKIETNIDLVILQQLIVEASVLLETSNN